LFSAAPGLAKRDFDEALRLDPGDGRALSGRALANVQQRKVDDAVADARASAAADPGDSRLLYNAARVLCQAAACLESDPGRKNADWEAAGRYRREALDLITQSLNHMPVAERVTFWRQVIRPDNAIEPIRNSKRFLEIDAQLNLTSETGATSGVPAS
jgi:tetratricopeptide (TPR) repeat protein